MNIMENTLTSLSIQDLVALEKMISAVCRKYENIAEMNKLGRDEMSIKEFQKSTNALSFFNNKRNLVLDEMEKRITNLV